MLAFRVVTSTTLNLYLGSGSEPTLERQLVTLWTAHFLRLIHNHNLAAIKLC